MTTFELSEYWTTFEDRLAWNIQARIATFRTRASAHLFKLAAGPTWTVYYEYVNKPEVHNEPIR
jgi:hypothetical protein